MAEQPTALERFIQGILPENPVFRQLARALPDIGGDQQYEIRGDHGRRGALRTLLRQRHHQPDP